MLAWQAQKWNTMPEAGGLLDQPAGLVKRMTIVHNTYEVFRQRYTANDVIRWIENNPEAYDHYAAVKIMLRKDGYR